MSENPVLSSDSTHSPAKAQSMPLATPSGACRAVLMLDSSVVTLAPPTMPRAIDSSTMGQNGLSRCKSSRVAPRALWFMRLP
ncbi:hypothetical protein D3C78_1612940 [compost metagenome]